MSDNRLFGMFHASSLDHNKDVILKSLSKSNGVVRVVFATVALGTGIDLKDVNTIIHYGAPHSIEDYFQESGRGGRSGGNAKSIIYCKPSDCPLRKQLMSTRDKEVAAVWHYLENDSSCRRLWLLCYFDSSFTSTVQDRNACCDVCVRTLKGMCKFVSSLPPYISLPSSTLSPISRPDSLSASVHTTLSLTWSASSTVLSGLIILLLCNTHTCLGL